MEVFARITVGVDGTDWGFEALRQALLLAPEAASTLSAVTALDTAPAIHTGIHAAQFAQLLEQRRHARRPTGSSTAVPERLHASFAESRPTSCAATATS
jgi:nucleotide-binding universal stress UspA family protein